MERGGNGRRDGAEWQAEGARRDGRNGKRRELGGAEGRIEREGRLVFAEKGTGHFGNQPTFLRTHFGPHKGQLAIVDPSGGGDEGIAQAGTMDEMDIGGSRERTAVRQSGLT